MTWDFDVRGVEAPDAPTATTVAKGEAAQKGYKVRTVKRVVYEGSGRWTVVLALRDSPGLPTITVKRKPLQ